MEPSTSTQGPATGPVRGRPTQSSAPFPTGALLLPSLSAAVGSPPAVVHGDVAEGSWAAGNLGPELQEMVMMNKGSGAPRHVARAPNGMPSAVTSPREGRRHASNARPAAAAASRGTAEPGGGRGGPTSTGPPHRP